MPRTAPAVVAVCVLAVASLSACGGGEKPRTTVPSSAVQAAPTARPPSPSPTRPALQLTKVDLDAALLTRRDLPAGYRADTQLNAEQMVSAVISQCTHEYSVMYGYREGARATVGRAWATSTGRFIVQSLTLLPGGLDNSLNPLRTALARCTSWFIENYKYELTSAAYGPYGDESLSYVITVTQGNTLITHATVYVRVANLFMALRISVVSYRAAADAGAIFDQAVRKLPRP